MQHAAFKEFYNENREEYLFDDNRHVLQQEEGIPGRLRYNHHWLTLNYNYLKADNRMLNVALRGKYLNTPKSELDSRLYNPELSTSPWNCSTTAATTPPQPPSTSTINTTCPADRRSSSTSPAATPTPTAAWTI